MRVPIVSLVGQDVKGKLAITTQPEHFDLYERNRQPIPVHKLLSVEWHKEKNWDNTIKAKRWYNWLRITWEKDGSLGDCGFSGWREDYLGTPTVDLLERNSQSEPRRVNQ